MRIRSVVSVSLIAALLLGLIACGAAEKPATGESDHSSAEVQSIFTQPISTTTSEVLETTVSQNTTLPAVQGADSVETLLEKSLEYIRTKDYSKISDVHDVKAWLAYNLFENYYEEKYRDKSFSIDYLMEKANLIFSSPEALQEQDPELSQILPQIGLILDPESFFMDYAQRIRDAIQDGTLTNDSPSYKMDSEFLADFANGIDYLLEHSEIIQVLKTNGYCFGIEDLKQCATQYEVLLRYTYDLKDAQIEYHPEKSDPVLEVDGINSYYIGAFVERAHV